MKIISVNKSINDKHNYYSSLKCGKEGEKKWIRSACSAKKEPVQHLKKNTLLGMGNF